MGNSKSVKAWAYYGKYSLKDVIIHIAFKPSQKIFKGYVPVLITPIRKKRGRG